MGLLPRELSASAGQVLLEGEDVLDRPRPRACATCAARAWP